MAITLKNTKTASKTDKAPPPDPKAKAVVTPSAWDKLVLSNKLSASAEGYATNKTQSFAAYAQLALDEVIERQTLVSSGILQIQQVRAFMGYKLGPLVAAAEDPAFRDLDFRKARASDNEATKKLLQRWQSFVSHLDNAGVLIQRLGSVGIDVGTDFPSMNTSKLRALFSAWKRKATASEISLRKPADAAKATAILRGLYVRALKTSREDINKWFRLPCAVVDDGEHSNDPLETGDKNAAKSITFDTAAKIVANAKARRYKYEEAVAIRDAMTALIDTYKKSVESH